MIVIIIALVAFCVYLLMRINDLGKDFMNSGMEIINFVIRSEKRIMKKIDETTNSKYVEDE